MAISVKNHEDRITALEAKIISASTQLTELFLNTAGTEYQHQPNDITLPKGINLFDGIYFVFGMNNTIDIPNSTLVLTSTLNWGKKLDIYQGGDSASSVQRRMYLTKKSNTILTLEPYNTNVKLFQIVGIKFSNVILYYVSNIIKLKIYTKYKFRQVAILINHLNKNLT